MRFERKWERKSIKTTTTRANSRRRKIQKFHFMRNHEIFKAQRIAKTSKLTLLLTLVYPISSRNSQHQRFNGTSTTTTVASSSAHHQPAAAMQSRRSRVMHFEDKKAAFSLVVSKEELERVQEMRQLPEGFSVTHATTQQKVRLHQQRRRPPMPISARSNMELKSELP